MKEATTSTDSSVISSGADNGVLEQKILHAPDSHLWSLVNYIMYRVLELLQIQEKDDCMYG